MIHSSRLSQLATHSLQKSVADCMSQDVIGCNTSSAAENICAGDKPFCESICLYLCGHQMRRILAMTASCSSVLVSVCSCLLLLVDFLINLPFSDSIVFC